MVLADIALITGAVNTLLDGLSIMPFIYAGAMFAIVGIAIRQFKKVTR